jgi:hypothetical protein
LTGKELPVIKRIYKVETLKLGNAELSVLRLVSSEEVPKGELKRALDELELSDYMKDLFIEYVVKEGGVIYRKAIGKGLRGEISKWPVRLKRVALLNHSPENLDLNELEWLEVHEDIYVYEGEVKGAKAAIIDTEEGVYLVLKETLESHEKGRKRKYGRAEEDQVQ